MVKWFSNLNLPDEDVKMAVICEGWYDFRLLDKWVDSLCLHFQIFDFLTYNFAAGFS